MKYEDFGNTSTWPGISFRKNWCVCVCVWGGVNILEGGNEGGGQLISHRFMGVHTTTDPD